MIVCDGNSRHARSLQSTAAVAVSLQRIEKARGTRLVRIATTTRPSLAANALRPDTTPFRPPLRRRSPAGLPQKEVATGAAMIRPTTVQPTGGRCRWIVALAPTATRTTLPQAQATRSTREFTTNIPPVSLATPAGKACRQRRNHRAHGFGAPRNPRPRAIAVRSPLQPPGQPLVALASSVDRIGLSCLILGPLFGLRAGTRARDLQGAHLDRPLHDDKPHQPRRQPRRLRSRRFF